LEQPEAKLLFVLVYLFCKPVTKAPCASARRSESVPRHGEQLRGPLPQLGVQPRHLGPHAQIPVVAWPKKYTLTIAGTIVDTCPMLEEVIDLPGPASSPAPPKTSPCGRSRLGQVRKKRLTALAMTDRDAPPTITAFLDHLEKRRS
jgi:hypothetical protein